MVELIELLSDDRVERIVEDEAIMLEDTTSFLTIIIHLNIKVTEI
jgi:hypothetical protein